MNKTTDVHKRDELLNELYGAGRSCDREAAVIEPAFSPPKVAY